MGGRMELRTTDSPSTLLTINQYNTQYCFLSYQLYMHARTHAHTLFITVEEPPVLTEWFNIMCCHLV